jgi:hypothetical protein
MRSALGTPTSDCDTMSLAKPALLDFCHEILHNILIHLLPADLASVSRTCRGFNTYIKGNRLLWRDLYVLNFVSRDTAGPIATIRLGD